MAKRKGTDVDLLVGGAGLLAAFWTALVSEVESLGGTAKDLHRLVTPEGKAIIKGMAELIVGKGTEFVANVAQVYGNMITRYVSVDYSRKPQDAIKATHRAEYLKDSVVVVPASGYGIKSVTVEFFKPDRWMSDTELAIEFAMHGLEPDMYAVAAVNEADPEFADEHPNCTLCMDDKGEWCFVAFFSDVLGRYVYVHRNTYNWHGRWWFGGVRM